MAGAPVAGDRGGVRRRRGPRGGHPRGRDGTSDLSPSPSAAESPTCRRSIAPSAPSFSSRSPATAATSLTPRRTCASRVARSTTRSIVTEFAPERDLHEQQDALRNLHAAVQLPADAESDRVAAAQHRDDPADGPARLRRGLGRRAPLRRHRDHRRPADVHRPRRRGHPADQAGRRAWSRCRTTTRCGSRIAPSSSTTCCAGA